jgi:hypothetical protein
MTRSQFNALVSKAIDQGVEILSDAPVKRAFYYNIEKRLKTTRDGIPNNLQAFHKALLDLFDQGATILERRIARNIYCELGIEFVVHDGWSLEDYIKHSELQPKY